MSLFSGIIKRQYFDVDCKNLSGFFLPNGTIIFALVAILFNKFRLPERDWILWVVNIGCVFLEREESEKRYEAK